MENKINIFKIDDRKFKGIYFSLNFLMKADKNILSENSVLLAMLSKDTKKYGTQIEIEKYLASMYGASFSVNVEKYGDLENVEFKIECINPSIIDVKEDILKKCYEFLYDVAFDTKINSELFNNELFERERRYILEKISARKDEKIKYAVSRTEEIMSEGTGFGTYVYGDESYINLLDSTKLIKAYDNMLNNSVVTLIVSGNLENYDLIENEIYKKFSDVKSNVNFTDLEVNLSDYKKLSLDENFEKCDSVQSVMTLGMVLNDVSRDDIYAINVYNAILGSTPSSKLFQIFREKESLAYTTRSRYYRYKDLIIIYAGIQRGNYEKGKKVILDILDSIKNAEISLEEFEAAKQSLISDLKEWNDSKIMQAKYLYSDLVVYGENKTTIEEMEEKILNVTIDDVIRISRKVEIKKWYLLGGEENA